MDALLNPRLRQNALSKRLLVSLLLLFSGTVQAQAQAIPDAGQLLGDIQRSDKEISARPATPDLIEPAAPRPAIRLPEGVKIEVQRFRVTGNKSISSDLLAGLVKPWQGQELDVNSLNDAAGAITRHYQSQGFLLAYAYLPAQKIEQGVVEIAVLEGTVDQVQIVTAQDIRLKDEVIQRHVEDITQSPQILQADLERRLLLLNDIPGVVARAAFTPGARPGTADIVVTVAEEEPLANFVDFNKHGSESTGEYRLGATFHLNNLFGYGDSTRFRLQASEQGRLVNGSLNTRVPLGGNGWSAEAGLSHLTYELGPPFATLGARGEADVFHLGLNYALQRSLNANLNLKVSYDFKDLEDTVVFVGSNQKHSHQLGFGYSASNRDTFWGGGQTLSSLDLTFGSLAWDSGNTTGLSASGHFSKFNFDVSRRQSLGGKWSLLTRLFGQYAFDPLDSSEKQGLSGPYGVRAYAPGEASVDRGSQLALEIRRYWLLPGGTLNASLFYDYARGTFDVEPTAGVDNTVTLRGGGLGIGWSDGGLLDLSLTAAWRGQRAPSSGDDRKPYLYFQINQGF